MVVVGSEVRTVVQLSIQVFRDVTLCCGASNFWYFEGSLGTTHPTAQCHISEDVDPPTIVVVSYLTLFNTFFIPI
jgi:hypothetical protein